MRTAREQKAIDRIGDLVEELDRRAISHENGDRTKSETYGEARRLAQACAREVVAVVDGPPRKKR